MAMARRVVRCDATTNGRRRHQLTNMDVRPGRRDVHAASTADVDAGPGHVGPRVIRLVARISKRWGKVRTVCSTVRILGTFYVGIPETCLGIRLWRTRIMLRRVPTAGLLGALH